MCPRSVQAMIKCDHGPMKEKIRSKSYFFFRTKKQNFDAMSKIRVEADNADNAPYLVLVTKSANFHYSGMI